MRYFGRSLVIIASLCHASSLTAADTSRPVEANPAVLNDNAALQYWQAFSQMPALDKDQEKLLAEWRTAPLDDPAVQKIVDQSRASLRFLHRAARMKHCDWGLEYHEGISLMLPHLAKSRDLARIAALAARYDFENGHKQSLAANASGIMVLARHVGRDPFLICQAVRQGLEEMTVDLVAPYVPQIEAPHAEVVAMFEAMPRSATLHESILAEKTYIAPSIVAQLNDAEKHRPGGWREMWRQFLQGSDVPQELRDIDSLEELTKLVDDFFATYDEFAEITTLPQSEFDSKYQEFARKLATVNKVSVLLLPTVDKIAAKEYRNQARMAMLLAGIAITDGGPEKLQEIRDPFGDGPFEHQPLENGYELRSKLVIDGKPVTLIVGRPKTDR